MSGTTSTSVASLAPLDLHNYPDIRESYVESTDLTYHLLSAGDTTQEVCSRQL